MQIFAKKTPQVHLIITKEWPKNTPPILRNLDNFPPGAFYPTHPPLQLGTKEFFFEPETGGKTGAKTT